MLIQVQIKIEQIKFTCFNTFIYKIFKYIYLQVVMYHFEHIDHDIHPGFLI